MYSGLSIESNKASIFNREKKDQSESSGLKGTFAVYADLISRSSPISRDVLSHRSQRENTTECTAESTTENNNLIGTIEEGIETRPALNKSRAGASKNNRSPVFVAQKQLRNSYFPIFQTACSLKKLAPWFA